MLEAIGRKDLAIACFQICKTKLRNRSLISAETKDFRKTELRKQNYQIHQVLVNILFKRNGGESQIQRTQQTFWIRLRIRQQRVYIIDDLYINFS